MAELSVQFDLEVALPEALWACKEAVAGMDWHVASMEPERLVLTKGLRLSADSLARIEVRLARAGPLATTVDLNGKIPWAFGPWYDSTLRSLMNALQNAIEVAARRSASQH